jgi:hypothetical protein
LDKQIGQHEHQLATFQSLLLAAVRRFKSYLARLGSELKAVRGTKNSEAVATPRSKCKKSPPAAVPSVPARLERLDSLIVCEYPPLLEGFRMKK